MIVPEVDRWIKKTIQEWVCHLNEYTTANKHGDYTRCILSNSSSFFLSVISGLPKALEENSAT